MRGILHRTQFFREKFEKSGADGFCFADGCLEAESDGGGHEQNWRYTRRPESGIITPINEK
jgi:hypothetical protein